MVNTKRKKYHTMIVEDDPMAALPSGNGVR